MEKQFEYTAEVTFHQGSPREFTDEGIFAPLDEAVQFIERQAFGIMMCRAWINGREIIVRNGKVIGRDANPLGPNPTWPDSFAQPAEKPAFRPERWRTPSIGRLLSDGTLTESGQ